MIATPAGAACPRGPHGPEPLYLSPGFRPTGEIDEGEVVMDLRWMRVRPEPSLGQAPPRALRTGAVLVVRPSGPPPAAARRPGAAQ
jgi:hypothetical protein